MITRCKTLCRHVHKLHGVKEENIIIIDWLLKWKGSDWPFRRKRCTHWRVAPGTPRTRAGEPRGRDSPPEHNSLCLEGTELSTATRLLPDTADCNETTQCRYKIQNV